MTLHNSKRTAILQLCNSISSLDLENIQQLADGRYFCDLTSSVCKISPELHLIKDPGTSNVESIGDKDSEDAPKNPQVLAPDLKVDEKVPNDEDKTPESKKVSEDKTPESKKVSDDKTPESKKVSEGKTPESKRVSERRSSLRISRKKDSLSNLDPEIPNFASEIPASAPDIPASAPDILASAPDIPASVSEIPASVPETPASAPEIPASASETAASAPEILSLTPKIQSTTPEFLDDISKRYSFLQKFIDDTYEIESGTIIMYSLCVNSDELELAKVAVLILSSVVKHYLSSKKDVLNTLALLDHEVQEDIKECLSFLLPDKKVTKHELEYILTKHAQYKRSPRSPRSTITPHRSCSSRYKKSVLAVTPSNEDVFSDSPLKSFFESPHFKNRELLTKELAKTRKMFLSEEQRSEDLMLEVNSLKKKLEHKEKENKVLKDKIKKVRSKEETNQCKSCEDTRIKLDSAKTNLKRQKKEFKDKENDQEKDICHLTAMVSLLENRLKTERRMRLEQSVTRPSRSAIEEQQNQIIHLQIECGIKGKELEALRREYYIYKAKNDERKTIATRSNEPVTPVAGECLGSVIEEEYRQLLAKSLKLKSVLEKLQNQKCVNSQGVEIINEALNISAMSQSNISIPVLMDVSEISEPEKDTNINNDAETGDKGEPSFSGDGNLNDAEAVNKRTLNVLNDSDLNNVIEIDNKDASRVFNDNNLSNVTEINNKDTPSLSIDSNLKNDADLDNKDAPSLSNEFFILTSMQNVNEEKQTSDSSLRKSKSSAVFERENVPVVNSVVGSLWSQYNDSGSEWESSVGVSISNNADGLSRQDLLKKLGFSEAEYSTKLGIAKKLWALFKELFTTNGSNGFVGLSLKSDEDYIMCLLPIREYLFRFQNNNSISKDCVLPDKNLCNCNIISDTVQELRKENEEMKLKLSESYTASYIEHKDAEMKELLGSLDAMQQKHQELIKTNEDLNNKKKALFQQHEGLKKQMTKMVSKISEADQIKDQCANLLNDKNEADRLHKRRLKLCRDKIITFDIQKREFQAAIEREKALRRDLMIQIESLKSEVMSLKVDRKCLERGVKELRAENLKLSSYIEAMKEKEAHAVKSKVVSCSIPVHNSRPQYDKNSEININVKVQDGKSCRTASVHNMSVTSSNCPSKIMSLDASQISASFNKSLHGFALITDDEEEYSFQGDSLAEIKKDYDNKNLTGKERRVTELHRRNTMYLPHMQSSYPVELQSMSPFSQKLLEHMEKTNEEKPTQKNEVPASSVTSCDQAVKKRKVEEVEPECEAGPSQLPDTPAKAHKHFKTPSSLQKLLRNYRPKSRQPIPKPKS